MAVQANTNVKTDFAKAQSIDFVTRFNGSITKLQELLGLTRKTALSNGSLIKTYTSSVTLAAGMALLQKATSFRFPRWKPSRQILMNWHTRSTGKPSRWKPFSVPALIPPLPKQTTS